MADDIDRVIDELPRQGFIVERTTSGHYSATPPKQGLPLVHFARSKENRSFINTLRDLRRAGFVWPPPDKRLERGGGVSSKAEICCTKCAGRDCRDAKCECHAPTIPKAPPTTEQLYRSLIESRSAYKAADDFATLCAKEAAKAQDDLRQAIAERDAARAKWLTAKKAFDDETSPPEES